MNTDMKTKQIIGLMAMLAVASIALLSGGCATEKHPDGVVVHDTVNGDYLMANGKWSDISKARYMTYADASRWLNDYRKNERGEYANTGAKNYPVKLESIDVYCPNCGRKIGGPLDHIEATGIGDPTYSGTNLVDYRYNCSPHK